MCKPTASWMLVGIVCLMFGGVGMTLTAAAQPAAQSGDTTLGQPVTQIEAGDFRALAVTSDGDLLMVADAANNQVRVYSIASPDTADQPSLVSTVDVDGVPLNLVASDDFAVVSVATSESTDLVQVIAPADYDPSQPYAPVTWIDIPKNPTALAISPDERWAVVVTGRGYTLMELLAADNVNSINTTTNAATAALTNDMLFVASSNRPLISVFALEQGAQTAASGVIELDAPAVKLAINGSMTMGAAVLNDGRITLFDPVSLAVENVIEGEASPAGAYFLDREDAQWLLVLNADRDAVTIYDVSDPATPEIVQRESLDIAPVQAIAVFGDRFYVANDSRVIAYVPE